LGSNFGNVRAEESGLDALREKATIAAKSGTVLLRMIGKQTPPHCFLK
jgi:hypothetical protein